MLTSRRTETGPLALADSHCSSSLFLRCQTYQASPRRRTDVEEVPLRTVEVGALELQSILQGKEACQAPLSIKRRGDGSGDGRTRKAEGGQGAAREDRDGGRPLDETVKDLSYLLAGCRRRGRGKREQSTVVDGNICSLVTFLGYPQSPMSIPAT